MELTLDKIQQIANQLGDILKPDYDSRVANYDLTVILSEKAYSEYIQNPENNFGNYVRRSQPIPILVNNYTNEINMNEAITKFVTDKVKVNIVCKKVDPLR